MQKVYISGPMTGYENYNYPAFYQAEKHLKATGFNYIENPARNPEQASWEDYMKVALRQMLLCDTVVLISGWADSKGAREEVSLAHKLNMKVITLETLVKGGVSI